jgi:hypothetical protein
MYRTMAYQYRKEEHSTASSPDLPVDPVAMMSHLLPTHVRAPVQLC